MLRTPQELVEIGFSRSRVVMMNEAHSRMLRCVRTRNVGRSVLPTAHELGVRHLAMEALTVEFAQECNQTRRVRPESEGYLAQPEMQALIQAALDLGWTLIAYEADDRAWIKERLGPFPTDEPKRHQYVREVQKLLLGLEHTNWREREQAANLTRSLSEMGDASKLLVWCGNNHLLKAEIEELQWSPMGFRFRQLSQVDPFTIDQTVTVLLSTDQSTEGVELLKAYADEVRQAGGTAGYLTGEGPEVFWSAHVDALLLSLDNLME